MKKINLIISVVVCLVTTPFVKAAPPQNPLDSKDCVPSFEMVVNLIKIEESSAAGFEKKMERCLANAKKGIELFQDLLTQKQHSVLIKSIQAREILTLCAKELFRLTGCLNNSRAQADSLRVFLDILPNLTSEEHAQSIPSAKEEGSA